MRRILLTFILALIFLSCKNDCKDPTLCSMSTADVAYFGKIHPDYSWTYFSFAKERKDSIYIYKYNISWHESDESECTKGMGTHMKIVSDYLGYNQCSFANYFCDKRSFSMYSYDTLNSRRVTFLSYSDQYEDAVILDSVTIPVIDTLITSAEDTLKIPPFDTVLFLSSKTYQDVLYKDNLWFAPNFGIIQFVSPETKDTFCLQKFYKKQF